jgi:hypothetical protein
MKKRILLIPDSDYLSNPIYLALGKLDNSRLNITYLNPSFPITRGSKKKNYSTSSIKNSFDQYESIDEHYFDFFHEYFNKSIFSKINNVHRFIKEYGDYVSTFYKIFDHLEPAAIVLTSDKTTTGVISNAWAAENNVPVIIIQSAFIEGSKVNVLRRIKRYCLYTVMNIVLKLPYVPRQFKYGHENDENYMCVWGTHTLNYFKARGVNDRLIITGNPVFDSYSMDNDAHNEAIESQAKNRPIVSIFTTPYEEILTKKQENIVLETFKSLISNNHQWFFVIKIHPRQRSIAYEQLLASNPHENYCITDTSNIAEVFGSSDVQISLFSYTSFQAVIAGVPIILFKDEYIKHHDNFNNEVELRANNLGELENAIILSFRDDYKEEYKSKRQQYLDTRLHSLDQKSSERVINNINKIISTHI